MTRWLTAATRPCPALSLPRSNSLIEGEERRNNIAIRAAAPPADGPYLFVARMDRGGETKTISHRLHSGFFFIHYFLRRIITSYFACDLSERYSRYYVLFDVNTIKINFDENIVIDYYMTLCYYMTLDGRDFNFLNKR